MSSLVKLHTHHKLSLERQQWAVHVAQRNP
jgi:hypothetical protein